MIEIPYTKLFCNNNEIFNKCKETNEPIFLTKSGKIEFVVIPIEEYEKQQASLKLKERLLNIEFEQKEGAEFHSVAELYEALRRIVDED